MINEVPTILYIQGTELEFSGLQIDFKADIHKTEYCKVALNDNNLKAFLYAGNLQRFANKIELSRIFHSFLYS